MGCAACALRVGGRLHPRGLAARGARGVVSHAGAATWSGVAMASAVSVAPWLAGDPAASAAAG